MQAKVDSNSSRQEALAKTAWKWVALGFPSSKTQQNEREKQQHDINNWKSVQIVLLAWLMPDNMKWGRSHANMWRLCATIAALNALHDMVKYNDKRRQLRVICRGLGYGVQKSIITGQFRNKEWYVFVQVVFSTFWAPQNFSAKIQAVTYYMWAMQQKAWYVGKAELIRESGDPSSRFREHMLNTFKPHETCGREKRYQTWKGAPMHTLCFIPFAWGYEEEILMYERHITNSLQAPMQDRVKYGSYVVSKFRPWKRFRKTPTIAKELELNQCIHLRKKCVKIQRKKWDSAPNQRLWTTL